MRRSNMLHVSCISMSHCVVRSAATSVNVHITSIDSISSRARDCSAVDGIRLETLYIPSRPSKLRTDDKRNENISPSSEKNDA